MGSCTLTSSSVCSSSVSIVAICTIACSPLAICLAMPLTPIAFTAMIVSLVWPTSNLLDWYRPLSLRLNCDGRSGFPPRPSSPSASLALARRHGSRRGREWNENKSTIDCKQSNSVYSLNPVGMCVCSMSSLTRCYVYIQVLFLNQWSLVALDAADNQLKADHYTWFYQYRGSSRIGDVSFDMSISDDVSVHITIP